MARAFKILGVDGGGIRGIIPAIILGEIERRSGQPVSRLFDLMAGTSTGGMLVMALNIPDEQGQPSYTADEAALVYTLDGPTIFSRSMWRRMQAVGSIAGAKYPSEGIDEVADRWFGDVRLSQALGDVLVTSYEIQTRKPWFFRSRKAREGSAEDFLMRDVVRATTAAPTYFSPAQLFHANYQNGFFAMIDGSLHASNPTMAAYVEARSQYPAYEDFLVLSLGTGEHTRSIDYEAARGWGLAGWSQHVMDIVFDGMNSTVDYQLRHLLPSRPDGVPRYYRFQVRLAVANDDMDDASKKNLDDLRELAGRLIDDNDALLDQIVTQLLLS